MNSSFDICGFEIFSSRFLKTARALIVGTYDETRRSRASQDGLPSESRAACKGKYETGPLAIHQLVVAPAIEISSQIQRSGTAVQLG